VLLFSEVKSNAKVMRNIIMVVPTRHSKRCHTPDDKNLNKKYLVFYVRHPVVLITVMKYLIAAGQNSL
jgi:hypothetical protein